MALVEVNVDGATADDLAAVKSSLLTIIEGLDTAIALLHDQGVLLMTQIEAFNDMKERVLVDLQNQRDQVAAGHAREEALEGQLADALANDTVDQAKIADATAAAEQAKAERQAVLADADNTISALRGFDPDPSFPVVDQPSGGEPTTTDGGVTPAPDGGVSEPVPGEQTPVAPTPDAPAGEQTPVPGTGDNDGPTVTGNTDTSPDPSALNG